MKWLMTALALGALIFAACGGSDDDGADAEPTATESASDPTEAAPASTEEPSVSGPEARPETAASSPLDRAYFSAVGAEFDASVMGFDINEVSAQWYQADGFYVVVYEGLDLAATGPLCPGNSLDPKTGPFVFVSNAPTEGADCSTFPTLSEDPEVGVLTCDGMVSYRTEIPSTEQGVLYGTIERSVDGAFMGVTSLTPTTGTIPEIDLDLLSC